MSFEQTDPDTPSQKVAFTALWLTLLCVLAFGFVLSKFKYDHGLKLIPASQIQLYEASEVSLPRAQVAADNVVSNALRRKLPSPLVSQYHVTLPKSDTSEALLILGIGGEARVYINGIGVKSSTLQVNPGPVQGGHWLYSDIPPALLNTNDNRLDIIAAPSTWRTGLGSLALGSSVQVEAAARAHRNLQNSLHVFNLVAGLICLVCAPFMFVIGRARLVTLASVFVAAALVATYFAGEQKLISPVISTLLSWSDWILSALAVMILTTSQQVPGRTGGVQRGFAVALLLGALISVIGWRFSFDYPFAMVLSQIAPIALAGIGMPLLVATSLKNLLDERAYEREQALRQSALLAQQAKVIEKQAEFQAVIEERKRFTRDIHDGIGGQLVSLLWRVRSETVPADELASEIESGIADLRLVADALEEGPVSLSVAMWNFAGRARQQLDAADMAFEWSLPNDLDVAWTDARQILSLYRMLQESVANAVRHAKAKSLSITFEEIYLDDLKHIRVIIEDDGIGFDPNLKQAGRGVTNLRTRAAQMGGHLTIETPPSNQGTRIILTVPASQQVSV